MSAPAPLPDQAALEAALEATWPAAATRSLGPFTLREGAGGGKRASAATAEGLPTAAETAAALAAMGAAALVRLRPGQEALDAELAARGLRLADPTLLLAAPVAALAGPVPFLSAIPSEAPLAIQAEIWEAGGTGPARQAVMARVAGPRTWLLARIDDRPAGAAFCAAAPGGIAMLHALHILPRFRRRGAAGNLLRRAAAWAAGAGAATLALATTEANAPARALFAALGFVPAGRYWYRSL